MTLNRRGFLLSTSMLGVAPLLTPRPAAAQTSAQASATLPHAQAPFEGEIGTTYKESKPDFPKPIAASPQAPNVVLILLDDIGFGQPSTFGGSVPTPAFDALAQGGLRYNQFHSTALCSPTRSAFARMQEVFAGFVAHTDHEVSRLLAALDETGQADNTLVILIVGDNGPGAEGTLQGTLNDMATQQGVQDDFQYMLDHIDEIGGPLHENHYPVGWAWAGSAPFQWMKQVASHFGGTRNGMVVSWPKRIADHCGLRRQFHHVIDIAPTIYEAAGIGVLSTVSGVAQQPVEGISVAYAPDKANADAPSQRTTQYFEIFGNRAVYRDGWVAAARHGRLPWLTIGSANLSQDKWQLYNIREDSSQATDLAARYPDKLKELQALFLDEARRYNVLPLDDRFAERADPSSRPSTIFGRSAFTYFSGVVRIPEGSAPIEKAGSHRIEADLVMPAAGAEGVIVTSGGASGGYALFVEDGKLVYIYSYFGREQTTLTSPDELPRGTDVKVSFEFHADAPTPGAPGVGQLFIDGRKVAEARIAHRVPYRNSATETFDVGRDTGAAVIHGLYEVPFAFAGGLKRLDFNSLSAIGASGIGPDAGGDEGNGVT